MTHLHMNPVVTADAVQIAQDLGKQGHPNPELLGVGLALAQNRLTRQMAVDAGDTTYSDTPERASAIIKRCGFVSLGRFDVEVDEDDAHGRDYVEVYRHAASNVIATLESYGTRVNRIMVYFVLPYAENSFAAGQGYSGGLESASNPNWRRDPKCFDRAGWPADLVHVGYYSASDFFASRFAQLLEFKPVPRPVTDVASILDQVFITGRDIRAIEKQLKAELGTTYAPFDAAFKRHAELAMKRVQAMCVSPDLFGGPSRYA